MMSSKGSHTETGERPARLSDPKVPNDRSLRIGKNSARGHRCHTCRPPKFFLNALELKVHRASKHFQEECVCPEPDCDRKFNNKNSLRRHIENHERIGTKTTKPSLKQVELYSNSTDAESLLSKDAPRPNRPSTGTDNQQSKEGEQQSVSHATLGSRAVEQQKATHELTTHTLSKLMIQSQEPQREEEMESVNSLENAPGTDMIWAEDQPGQADVNNASQRRQEWESRLKAIVRHEGKLLLLRALEERFQWDRMQTKLVTKYLQNEMEKYDLEQSLGAQQQQQQQQQQQPQPPPPPQNAYQHPAQHLRQPQGDGFNHGDQDPDQASKSPISRPPLKFLEVEPHEIKNARKANPEFAGLGDAQIRASIIQITQRQSTAIGEKEMKTTQVQERLIGIPSKLQLKAALTSCSSIHSTISKDNTSGKDARVALLFADLGERLNSCPKTSWKNKPET